jgi:inhibitor of cysteine peptidase
LDITLDANPTTGYQWEVAEVDAQVLKLLGEPEYTTSGTMPGSGGQTTFHFQAAGTGQTPLQLIYRRSFEKDQPPADTFEVDVVVK